MTDDNATPGDTTTEAQTPQGQPNDTNPAPTPTGGENGGEKAAQRPDGENVSDLPEWAQRIIRDTRAEAADQRTGRQADKEAADARVKAILQAAGIDTGDDDGDGEDPVKAAADAREAAEREAREARLELAIHRAAGGLNADPAALLDSRAFLTRAADLDPSDQEAVAGAIRDAIKDNPKLAVTQAAPRNHADFTGASGDGAITPEKFRDMDMGQRNELYHADPDTYRRLAATTK